MATLFTDDDVVSRYSRAEALADGLLVDVTATAREAGIRYPVAVTRRVWDECVAWNTENWGGQGGQDEAGRLWDLVWMLRWAMRTAPADTDTATIELRCVPNTPTARRATIVRGLISRVGPGGALEPVVTVMFRGED